MKSKKAFLLGKYTVTIIIAVLCLLLLSYLLFGIFSNSVDVRNLKMAGATLDELVGKMEEAKTNSPKSLILLNPEKWIMISYSGEEEKPEQCVGNCICVCTNDEPGWEIVSSDIDLCNALGVCKNFENKINKIEYQIRISSKIASLGGLLMKTAKELNIEYENEEFTITKNE